LFNSLAFRQARVYEVEVQVELILMVFKDVNTVVSYIMLK
jgi:hypothetical protein